MRSKHNLEEFRDLTNILTNLELDDSASKERIYNRLVFKMQTGTIQPNHTKKGEIHMKNTKWKSLAVSAIAIVCLCGAFSTTSFAQGMIQSILARFQVGNMEITQFDRELPTKVTPAEVKKPDSEARAIQMEAPPQITVEKARADTGIDFPTPQWLSDHYQFVNCVVQGKQMIEVQYKKEGDFISLLISRGGKNGIGTTDEVKTETIDGTKVYFANGIVLWEHQGFTYELYQMTEKDFDTKTLGQIIKSLSSESK